MVSCTPANGTEGTKVPCAAEGRENKFCGGLSCGVPCPLCRLVGLVCDTTWDSRISEWVRSISSSLSRRCSSSRPYPARRPGFLRSLYSQIAPFLVHHPHEGWPRSHFTLRCLQSSHDTEMGRLRLVARPPSSWSSGSLSRSSPDCPASSLSPALWDDWGDECACWCPCPCPLKRAAWACIMAGSGMRPARRTGVGPEDRLGRRRGGLPSGTRRVVDRAPIWSDLLRAHTAEDTALALQGTGTGTGQAGVPGTTAGRGRGLRKQWQRGVLAARSCACPRGWDDAEDEWR